MPAMCEDELRKALKNPETLFGYFIFCRDPIFDLRELLDSFKRTKLQVLASVMQLPGRSGLKKAELIDAIYDCCIESNLLHSILCRLEGKELSVFHEIMNADIYYVEDADFPYDFALTLLYYNVITAFYIGNRIVIVTFPEFKKQYVEALEELQAMLDEAADELDEYACAAANLYGAIPMEDFVRIYLERSGNDSDEETVRYMLADLIGDDAESEAPYRLRGDLLISDELEDWEEEELEDLMGHSRERPLYVPPQEQFLPYADWLYYEERPAHRDFMEFVRSKEGKNPQDAAAYKLLVGEICAGLRQWAQAWESFGILESFGVKLRTPKEIKRAAKLIEQMSDDTRIWGRNGMTPNELRAQEPTKTPYKNPARNVGRNDPCPCGSGKKYKYCCGRLLH
jgi:hypothetical protein